MTPEERQRRQAGPLSTTHVGPARAPEVLEGQENRRLKQMIKASLFADAHAPVKIGRYTVVRPLGAGGMGMVYAAYDDELDRRIAVKLLRSGSSEHDQARLLREAQAMAKLSHPNVVTVHEVGTFEGQVYVAMEFVRGQTLQEWLSEGPHPWRAVVDRFVAAGRGLAAAHAAGLVHRDFKPSNVLVSDDGRVRVSDFGLVHASGAAPEELAAQRSQVTPPTSALSTSLTMTGTIMGTPAYMSPEQHLGRATDARSDQFSFSVALYEAVFGVHPFAGDTHALLAQAVLAGEVREPPREGKVPVWLGRVLLRGLARAPEERWPSIDALLVELDQDPERRARIRRIAALIVGAVAAVIAGLLWLAQVRGEAAIIAAAAEAAAQERRDAAERERAQAQSERDRAFEAAKAQLAEAQAARADLERALADTERQRKLAEDQSALAEARRREAEEQRREADGQRREAEHQAERTREEARRARDATRLAQALGTARDDPTTVLALLRETERPADTPGWVPAAVDTLLQPLSRAILRAHSGTVHAAAFSPDGQTIATAADDGAVLLWEWRRDRVTRLGRHDKPVHTVMFSPDGDRLLTASADGSAIVWRDGAVERRLAHPGPVKLARFSPDGRQIATAQGDVARLWPLAGGPPRLLRGHLGPIHALAFSPDGARLATGATDGTARVWEVAEAGRDLVLGRHRGAVRALAFDPSGERLATAAQDGVVRLWELPGTDPLRELEGHRDEVVDVAFTADGEALISASLDGTARLWPALGAGEPVVLRGHRGRIYGVAVGPAEGALLTASQDGTARLWDRERPSAPPRVLRGHTEELASASFSADGRLVVTTSRDNTVRVWPLRRERDEATLLRHRQRVSCAAYDPGGASLLTCDGPREVLWWSAADLRRPRRRLTHGSNVLTAMFSESGDAILTVAGDGVIRRWVGDAAAEVVATTGERELRRAAYAPATDALLSASLAEFARLRGRGGLERLLRGHSGTLHALALSPDGALAATGGSDRSARLWRTADASAPRVLAPHSGRVTAIAFRGDGLEVATASWDKRIRVWSDEGALRTTLTGHDGPVWSVAYSPDGRSIVSASEDGTLRVWASDGRGEPVVLHGHEGPALSASFRPDGRAIVSGGDDRTARIWSADFDPESLQRRLWRASPVCLPARERVRLLAEDPAVAAAASDACAAAARDLDELGEPE